MTKTIIESKTKTTIIGFDQPFAVIGERINPTGRKKLALELELGDFSTVEADAIAQVAAGATILDINSGAVFANKMAEDPRYADNNFVEPPLMKELVKRVQAICDVPLCIDSSVPGALEEGLEAAEGRPLLNSVTGEEERLELVLPLVKKYNVPVVAISNDDTGISEDPDVRFEVAKKIVNRASDFGIPAHDIVVDPLVMPIGAMGTAGLQVFTLVRRLREELGVNTTCGASNISFGLPNRHGINNAFLPMAMTAGMTSAIMNPVALPVGPKKLQAKLDELASAGIIVPDDIDMELLANITGMGSTKSRAGKEMEAIRAANFLTNNDPNGSEWIRTNKDPNAGSGAGGRSGRSGGRRRRA
ncbi:MAG: methyltetrahydrofolate cobalamin methyltransferase [Amylibacter sp.]|jgi:5-methyltetrahydrofolate--homocysteine methyltransferase|nr:methyltetrahydrofolate cobalamin methyltransferase [Amylibacter sp.]RZO40936.1 MAG: methyltetrahydrofolate cobalamin methyltransferase [Paracoccaceae bacterium]MDA8803456.1 methyltetrahydrofolate cobalamin methyltransferase [Amylibacter sp.]MDA8811210.1 methyltetrahydrofolate cobalamin methyltransferase [Amylibacter sp.]MDB2610503.1 methyltetrahydrofolate cobalamin methyltransferase [Amylibacter sp.]|tara:strand:+ start:6898 stop:7977 length:1080 start_codon:yes stop_codon:yes gene_type:complete